MEEVRSRLHSEGERKVHCRARSEGPRSPPQRTVYYPIREKRRRSTSPNKRPKPASERKKESRDFGTEGRKRRDEVSSDLQEFRVKIEQSPPSTVVTPTPRITAMTLLRDQTPDSLLGVPVSGSGGAGGTKPSRHSLGSSRSSTPPSISARWSKLLSPALSGGESPEAKKRRVVVDDPPDMDMDDTNSTSMQIDSPVVRPAATSNGVESKSRAELKLLENQSDTGEAAKVERPRGVGVAKRKRPPVTATACEAKTESRENHTSAVAAVQQSKPVENGSSATKMPGADSATQKANKATKALNAKGDYRHFPKKAMEPCITALELVKSNLGFYAPLSRDAKRASPESSLSLEITPLEYPGERACEKYALVSCTKALEFDPIADIYATTQMIVEHSIPSKYKASFGDARNGILRSIQRAIHKKSLDDLKVALAAWNENMVELKAKKVFAPCEFSGPAASYHMVSHVLEQAYSRSVAPESNLLNVYEGFSNNVYGEVKHNFVNTIIQEARIKPNHVFVDMGSGIGNVVLQVAAQCLCDTYGIEVSDNPAKLAAKQKKEFISRMRYYAKPCGRITLKHSDFLEDAEMHEVIKTADVIFVNNYAFNAELNQNILAKFLDLKEGAVVISLRSFLPVDRPTARSSRRSNAIESIFTVKEHYFGRDCVSWMNEGGQYFIHTVDRKQLAKRYK